jgi:hypothetical protein
MAETSFPALSILHSTRGVVLVLAPQAYYRDWNNPAKAGRTSTNITAHNTARRRASGSPLGAIKAWKA